MFDLNHAERRALAGATCLIGLGLLGRVVLAPGPSAYEWEPSSGAAASLAGARGEVEAALARERRAQTPLAPDERLNPNLAPVEELRRLPGVGPALAEAIVRERERETFAAVEELTRVAGIGEITATRLAPHLELSPAAGSATRVACGPETIDMNRAAPQELERLPGIGPALAARIVAYRRDRGPFESFAALAAVRGLGERSIARFASRACLGKP